MKFTIKVESLSYEQRRYSRHPVNGWLMFFGANSPIDMAQIVNISKSGAFCASLSEIICPLGIIQGLEIFCCDRRMSVNGLKAKMVRSENMLTGQHAGPDIHCFTFGLEFFDITSNQLAKMENMLHDT